MREKSWKNSSFFSIFLSLSFSPPPLYFFLFFPLLFFDFTFGILRVEGKRWRSLASRCWTYDIFPFSLKRAIETKAWELSCFDSEQRISRNNQFSRGDCFNSGMQIGISSNGPSQLIRWSSWYSFHRCWEKRSQTMKYRYKRMLELGKFNRRTFFGGWIQNKSQGLRIRWISERGWEIQRPFMFPDINSLLDRQKRRRRKKKRGMRWIFLIFLSSSIVFP